MSKKSFDESALDNIIGGMTSPVESFPRKEEPESVPGSETPLRGKPGRKRKGVVHVTVSLPESTAGRLRALSAKTGQQISSIVDYLLAKTLDNYEKKHGKLVLPRQKRKELSEFLD